MVLTTTTIINSPLIRTLEYQSFPLDHVSEFKKKMLNWLRPFSIFCYLDNQRYGFEPHQAECLVGVGVYDFVQGTDIKTADEFLKRKEWAFGHLSYELQHPAHQLSLSKEDKIGFPLFYFFHPQVVLEVGSNQVTIHGTHPEKIFAEIVATPFESKASAPSAIAVNPSLSKEAYMQKIRQLQAHIQRGDCYEINFCQEFSASGVDIDPFACFENLMRVSPNPFSAFYRLHDKYLLCASPERFLAKKGGRVYSQPIKGTSKRNLQSAAEDDKLKQALRQSQKEQSENVMVVDLVRNDLTKICREASVKVDELFGVYSFPQVHQLISTVSGEVKEDLCFSNIVEALFPMGSMTGAPKHRVMQLIDEYEVSSRGIFSGSVGYIHPDGDFDFNVVIRSIMYNATRQFLSYQVGSGITIYSDAEQEWEECMVKAEAIRQVLAL